MDNFWTFFVKIVPVWAKWLMLAVGFFLIELMHASWVILWFGLGALFAALVALFFPQAIPYQVITFFVASSLLFLFARRITLALFFPEGKVEKFDPGTIGKEVLCVEDIDNHNSKGAVRLYGVPWNARSNDDEVIIQSGQRVEIIRQEGNTIIVHPVKKQKKE